MSKLCNKTWRYSVNDGSYGGIVYAISLEDAEVKLRNKYNEDNIKVWQMIDDDYFDVNNPDVLECYGG